MSNGHALLSPSGASRWMACTPSAVLESRFPDRAGVAAKEGTYAHFLGDILIKEQVFPETIKIIKEDLSKNQHHSFEMLGYMERYAAYVIEQFEFMKAVTGDAILLQEVKVFYTDYVDSGEGTADIIIIGDGTLQIIDLKYGKGVPVEARENAQMKLYALGALKGYEDLYSIDRVQMTIYQPRIDNISTWTVGVPELKEWAEKEVRVRAALATAGEGEFVVGDHCQFCKARPVCKAQSDYQLEIAVHDFKDSVLLDDIAIADILTRSKSFLSWIKAVNDHALLSAVKDNKQYPGFKLVEGRSDRIFTSKDEVIFTLEEEGFKPDQITKTQLRGITELTGLLGKKKFDTLIGEFIIKPTGKPTLVSVDDKRPELNSIDAAKADFEIENDETE